MRHVVTLVASICRLASFCCDRDGLPLGCEPPGSGGPAARVAEVLVAAVASGADLAADLAVGEGRRVHVRLRDSGLDRLLEGCEITGLEPLRGRTDDVGGDDRPGDRARRGRRAGGLAAPTAEEHGYAAIDAGLADVNVGHCRRR